MSSSEVEIKPCQDEFIAQLAELWKEYLVDQGEDPLHPYFDLEASTEGFRRILEGYMKREPGGFLVATVGDEVVGFVVSFKDAFGPNYVMKRRIGHIQVVHTKREFRRRGIATKLVNAALGYLKDNGCAIILAETGEKNTRSLKMLEKFDFYERGKLVTFIKKT
jgi:ribosomal protein S18 acetylase RimI-like enzyme